jgi:cell wall-associated NlpC family hydrolase
MKENITMIVKIILPLLFFLFAVSGCSLDREPPEAFTAGVKEIEAASIPDPRVALFSVDASHHDGKWHIEGETSDHPAYEKMQKLIEETFSAEQTVNHFQLLPPESFADTIYALVNVSVGNLRKQPKHSAEMVDQVLMGMELRLLKSASYWYLVQTPTDYLGWISGGTIVRQTAADLQKWRSSELMTVTKIFCQVFEEPTENSQTVCDLVLGNTVEQKSVHGSWMAIELADGRRGFVKSSYLSVYKAADNKVMPGRDAIVRQAKELMGIPYLWGGNSTKGLDCSGFTCTVFKSQGYQLPRDANMQVLQGEEIMPDPDFSNILAGDLIFFGSPDRITHVGICLGGSYFIHSSDDVHINSLNENDSLFNAYRKRTLRHIKRIIQ